MDLIFEDVLVSLGDFTLGPLDYRMHSEGGEIVVVVGPNGAGKTTLLDSIAGLINLQAGRIMLDGTEISLLPPQKRRVGYVSQKPYLFPNLTVEQNVLYGASDLGYAKGLMAELGIEDLNERKPVTLSGGEQQRVSIARAIATKPNLLLFDEPFSHLDLSIQEELRILVKRMVRKDKVGAIYVTHSVDEAYSVADRLLFMDGGKLVETVFPASSNEGESSRPRTRKFAEILGYRNFISGQVVESRDGIVQLRAGELTLEGVGEGQQGSTAILAIRPEDIAIFIQKPLSSSQRNVLPVRVSGFVSRGGLTDIRAENNESRISIVGTVTTSSLNDLGISRDDQVYAVFKAAAAHIVSG